ncbi:MAG: exodeoxyribonuclease VII small subunit [Lachnospiraceae bacterium]|nr:exodeoxyribonuclease VII small subunit [Lachnospiraceae bacterium]
MEKLTLEEALGKVDETLDKLTEDVPLEQSFALYKEGMELLKFCDERLKAVEGQVMLLNEEGELNEFQ